MRSSRLLAPIVAALVLSSCSFEGVPFVLPRDGAVSGPDVLVELWLPEGIGVELELDGVVVDTGGFVRSGFRFAGTLEDVPPGSHALVARYQVGLPIEVATDFEVATAAAFTVQGSVNQVFVTHATPGQTLELRRLWGDVVATGTADEQGSLVFREVRGGTRYEVVAPGTPFERSEPIQVASVGGSRPAPGFYQAQEMAPGFGYITMRDGTQLSVYVTLPGPIEDGPYPTVVNYSGYSPSEPGAPLALGGADLSAFCDVLPVLCDAPNHPSGLLAAAIGYATVGVNMRGTGCSGGAYDFFEPNQVLDGYDIIEIVASQPWVRGNKVGMVGISYPGISQLFVASQRPPGLAAITPLSIISGTDTTLAPGGMVNDGFAIEWASQVLDRAGPYGQGWEQGQVDDGDTVCAENQLLHSQKVDIIQKALDNPYYDPDVYDPLNPRTFVDRIEVPVFTTGAWQDEQTGGHFPELWDRFTGAPLARMTGFNGAHADGFSPLLLMEWKHFLDFFVAEEIQEFPPILQAFGPLLLQEIFGKPVGFPPPRFVPGDDFEQALAAYAAEPAVQVLFEMGGGEGPAGAGAPEPAFALGFEAWPPETESERWYLHADGSLGPFPPVEAESASSFAHDTAKGAERYDVNDAFERALPDITWNPWQPDRQVVFASEALADDRVMVGFASADLWVRSNASDADLEVLLSEIRPDGQEVYVTSGWLRASQRTLAPESTPLRPIPTRLEADLVDLDASEWSLVRIEIYPAAHVFRADSRIRISVSTPGGNKGRWKFDVLPLVEGTRHSISHSSAFPSSVLLPMLPADVVPSELPPLPACPGLRSQPCRDWVPHVNALVD